MSLSSKYSFDLAKMVIDFDVFKLVEGFLPSQEDLKKTHFS
jgi:hypothetical protein